MRELLPLPMLLPLVGAAASVLVGRSRTLQRVISLSVLTAVAGLAVAILVVVDRDGVVATQAGDWYAPVGITLVADRLSAVMLVAAAFALLAVDVYTIGQPGAERNHVGFQSVYLVLAAGVAGAFLTGDLFNLFVAIEMMLTASYVLITLGGRLEQVRSGMTYVVISLVASSLFLAALAFTYAATGTVNMADLAGRIAELPAGVQSALAGLFLVVFGIKAGLFPLFFWLPDSYPTAPSPVTAIFAGLLTKVGMYAILRTQLLLFPGVLPTWLLMAIAGSTMVVGVLGAIAQDDVKRILSFLIISSIGYMLMGMALFTVAGVAAAIVYIVHQIVLKTALFLAGGLIEHAGGSSRLSRLGDMVRTAPVVAVLFFVPAISLAGIPPMSGFAAKFALFDSVAASAEWWILAVAVVTALLTLFSIAKIWIGVFWAHVEAVTGAESAPPVRRQPLLMVVPTAFVVLATVALGIAAGPLYDYSVRAADDLVDPTHYTTVVLGEGITVTFAVYAVALTVVWVLAWGSLSVANVLSGLLVALLLLAITPDSWTRGARLRVRPVATARLAWFVAVGVVRSNLGLIPVALARRPPVHTGVMAVPLPDCSDRLVTLITNIVALTPGTSPVHVTRHPSVLYVHVLDIDDVETAHADVLRLAELAMAAFGEERHP